MIKIKEIKSSSKIKEYYCDDCGNKIKFELYTNHHCVYCNKDLCIDCAGEVEDNGDYTYLYCKDCLDATKECRDKLLKLENEEEKIYIEIEKIIKKRKEERLQHGRK